MPDVILDNEDLTVLGGPSSINVEIDFGPQGSRGSQFFISNGNPNSVEIGQTAEVFDLCLNVLGSDTEYQTLYQYQNVLGTETWVALFKLVTNTYSTNRIVSFTNGAGSVSIPVASIVPQSLVGSVTASNFNIQFNILDAINPAAASMSVSDLITLDDQIVLPISFKSKTFSGEDWVNTTGTKTVHLFITVV
jgi:hypothetical protein